MSASPSPASPTSPTASLVDPATDAMVVVDPVSTGANVAHTVSKRGYNVIAVFSGHTPPSLLHGVDPALAVKFVSVIEHDPELKNFDEVVAKLKALPYRIAAVLAGSELGVECADVLSNGLNLATSNSLSKSMARRDKYTMGEAVRSAGVRAVKQARVTVWSDVEAFVADLNPSPFKVVIKPVKSAGSDGVYLCSSIEELKEKFNVLIGNNNALGTVNDSAVCQEYLQGTEYVVDTMSRNGEHKLVALWAYDKRPFRGAAFVYYGMTALSADSEIARSLFAYQKTVLDALEVRYGPGHGEVIMTKTGPCLVEVGSRPHGGDGTFIVHADRCWGYNQVQCMVDAYMSQELFDAIPTTCDRLHMHGFKVDVVSHVEGTLKNTKYVDQISALPSFIKFDAMPKNGDYIYVTKDCFTMTGIVMLAHSDAKQLEADHQVVRSLESTIFEVDPPTAAAN